MEQNIQVMLVRVLCLEISNLFFLCNFSITICSQALITEELPISLAELMNLRPDLADALPRQVEAKAPETDLHCGESEQMVLQHLLTALNANILASEGSPLDRVLKLDSVRS